ncbi:MAG: radical SAM protein [Patescibacteria group bacterium]|nr:radical SAM protein [Patescibacteria group bacterium]
MEIVQRFEDAYPYVGRCFNGQRARRYVFKVRRTGKMIEGSIYEQRHDGVPIRYAIEVSSMFGCPIGCLFCASGNLGKASLLSVEEIVEQACCLADLAEHDEVPKHFCYQGIGESSLIPKVVIASAQEILGLYPGSRFKISTMGARPEGMLLLAREIPNWEALQVTFPHYENDQLKHILGNRNGYDSEQVLLAVREIKTLRPDIRIKFNFICIAGFNDNEEVVRGTVERLKQCGVLDGSEFKLSFLNATDCSDAHGLRCVGESQHHQLLSCAQEAGANAYVFGPMKDIKVGCGQLVADRLKL